MTQHIDKDNKGKMLNLLNLLWGGKIWQNTTSDLHIHMISQLYKFDFYAVRRLMIIDIWYDSVVARENIDK